MLSLTSNLMLSNQIYFMSEIEFVFGESREDRVYRAEGAEAKGRAARLITDRHVDAIEAIFLTIYDVQQINIILKWRTKTRGGQGTSETYQCNIRALEPWTER